MLFACALSVGPDHAFRAATVVPTGGLRAGIFARPGAHKNNTTRRGARHERRTQNNPSGPAGDPAVTGLSKRAVAGILQTKKGPSWICKVLQDRKADWNLREAGMEGHQAHLHGRPRTPDSLHRPAEGRRKTAARRDGDDRTRGPRRPPKPGIRRLMATQKAGAFASTSVTRWSSSDGFCAGEHHPRTKAGSKFAITQSTGPEAKERRGTRWPERITSSRPVDWTLCWARGPMFDDSGHPDDGSFMIMEFPDLAACEEFLGRGNR